MKKGFSGILAAAATAISPMEVSAAPQAAVATGEQNTAPVVNQSSRKVYKATLDDIENLERQEEFSSHLMGLMYDYHRYSKNQEDLVQLMAQGIDQKKLKNRAILYTITAMDRKAKDLKLVGVDWNDALTKACQKNVAKWEDMAQRKGVSVEDYLAEELAHKIHLPGAVNGNITSLLSHDCEQAARKKHWEIYDKPNEVLLKNLMKNAR